MAGNKYIKYSGGKLQEVISNDSSAGAGDAGKIVALNASGILADSIINATVSSAADKIVKLDGTGKLDSSVMPVGIGADTASIQASENLAAGDFVNIHDASGARVRKADASTSGKEANGFVLSAVTSGQNALVYFEGQNTQLTGKTVGTRQYLSSSTPGATTETPPSGSGNVVQYLGTAFSATAMTTEIEDGIILA